MEKVIKEKMPNSVTIKTDDISKAVSNLDHFQKQLLLALTSGKKKISVTSLVEKSATLFIKAIENNDFEVIEKLNQYLDK